MARTTFGLIAGGLVAIAAIGGCAGSPASEAEVSNGLLRLAGPEAPAPGGPSPLAEIEAPLTGLAAAAAGNAALDILAWQDRKAREATEPERSAPGPAPGRTPAPEPVLDELASASWALEAQGPPAPPETSLDAEIGAAVDALGPLLRERAGVATDRFGATLGLAALTPLRPGIGDDALASVDLSPGERRTLGALVVLLSGLGEPGVGGDPSKAADAMQRALGALGEALPLRIGAAELCTRVDGFGQFQPVGGNVFEAMRPNRVIVYTEVERFAYRPTGGAGGARPARPDDRWAVSLTQQLELYNESGAMSAWSRPALPIVETSRTQRRDFHIVDQIDLPPNLTIGLYHLKITVKDVATGAQDTRTIPLRIVADAALARVGG